MVKYIIVTFLFCVISYFIGYWSKHESFVTVEKIKHDTIQGTNIHTTSIEYETIVQDVDTAAILRDCLATKEVSVDVKDSTLDGTAHIILNRNNVVGFKLDATQKILQPLAAKKDKRLKFLLGMTYTMTSTGNPISFSPMAAISYNRFLFTSTYDVWSKHILIGGAYTIKFKK